MLDNLLGLCYALFASLPSSPYTAQDCINHWLAAWLSG